MPATRRPPKPRPPRAAGRPARAGKAASLDLALQGGGSHGAFTWGVLDRLLQDESLAFDGVSGTSAGALNAAVLATGLAEGGRDGARAALRAFWLDVSAAGGCFGTGLAAAPLAAFNLDANPFYQWGQQFMRLFSPYQFNPLGTNPLREVLGRHVREDALRRGALALFVTATAVRTGQPRVFRRDDLTLDALLASACLPQLFQAVTVDGQPYWDGGYSGNPALWPLIYETDAIDLLLVKINPLVRPDLPDTPAEIADRVNEITFNAGLLAELRAIGFVQRLVADGRLDGMPYKSLRLHQVADDAALAPLNASSKLNTERAFLERLHDLGWAAADRWLLAHRGDIGQRATLDPADVLRAGA